MATRGNDRQVSGAGGAGSPWPEVIPVEGGIRLRVRVKPGASRTAILGRGTWPGGEAAIVLAVSAPPEDGKANAAVIQLLAKAIGLPKTSLSVVVGATARNKLIQASGQEVRLIDVIRPWIEALAQVK
jgi:uncharacterized protein (TIGR00251 family)